MKKTFYLLTLTLFFIGSISCSKDDNASVDPRDQYVGRWEVSERGSFTIFQFGENIGTIPINNESVVHISKTGENGLKIGNISFTLNGNNLSANPQSETYNQEGVTMVGTSTYSGSVSSSIITITSDITGSWSNNQGASGDFSGSVISTLQR